jgi:hypothetical protein
MIRFVKNVGHSGELKWNSVQGGMRMQIRKAEQVQGDPNHLDPHQQNYEIVTHFVGFATRQFGHLILPVAPARVRLGWKAEVDCDQN